MPTSKFQMVVMGVFAVLLIASAIVFSAYKGSSGSATKVTIWGTISKNDFENIIKETSLYQNKTYTVDYVEKSAETFDDDFVEALASGNGPDIFMLPSEKILKNRNKIYPIPYSAFTERQFKDAFIEGSEIYMASEGTLALPVTVDPLVMYWNRSIFTDNNLTEPPKYWDEFYDLAKTVSQKDGSLNITKSLVAFGEFDNIENAKAIILNLTMQAGSPVTSWSGGNAVSVFSNSFNKAIVPAEAAINFYTEFSNPTKTSYSWNRSLPNSTKYFLSGDLALYFGFASEVSSLQVKNPNLNFDVSVVPMSRDGGENVIYANYNAFAITKASTNKAAAFAVISILTGSEADSAISNVLNLPPVRRDLLSKKQTDSYKSVFYESAIKSQGWLDPSPTESDSIFQDMVKSITSGRSKTSEAIQKANSTLSSLLSK